MTSGIVGRAGLDALSATRTHLCPGGVVTDWLGTRGTARAGVMISLGCGTTGAAEVDGSRFFFLLFFFWTFGCARGGGAEARGAMNGFEGC